MWSWLRPSTPTRSLSGIVSAPFLFKPIPPDHRAVEQCAILQPAALGRIIHMNDPKALVVALGPLEVIHQRPGEIAGQRRAFGDRGVRGREVAGQVARACLVV